MKILLINNNPVVSRLTALSARKEEVEIDEVQEVTELHSNSYDIVFVDAESWSKDVHDVISEDIQTQKLVLFYADGDEEEKSSFDLSILKPFLPSEVSAVIRSIEDKNPELSTNVSSKSDLTTLDDSINLDNDETLFDLGELDSVAEKKEEISLPSETKTDLELDDDLSFDDKLEESFPLNLNSLDDDLSEDKLSIEKPVKKDDNDLFKLDLNDEVPSLEDDLFADDKKEETFDAIDKLEIDDKVEETKAKVEDSSLLEVDDMFALEMDEPEVEEVKPETQVLDGSEIENIKDILTEDNSTDMDLEDLMPAMSVMPSIEKEKFENKEVESKEVEKKKKEIKKKKKEDDVGIDSNILSQTLTSMPIENLRELLAGSKINIQIKFPKSK